MNPNSLIITVLVGIVVIGGGIWLFNSGVFSSGTMATSTAQTNTGNTNPAPSQSAAAPLVTTGTLVVATNSTAVVTGRVVSNGSQTSYWYEYGQTTALVMRTASQTIGSGYLSIAAPAFLSGLGANTTYYFRLVAENGLGTVSGATLNFTTNNNPPTTGNAPTTHTNAATANTRTTANLNGDVNPNHSETSYWFEYGTSSSLGNTTAFQSAGAGNTAVTESISVSDLALSTKYYFRMNSQNQFGTVNGAILTFTTAGPSAGSTPSAHTGAATSVKTTSATLHGTVNPNGDSTTYWFEYSDSSILGSILGSTTHTVVTGSGTTNIDVSSSLTGLTSGTTYSYRLVTMNSFGTVNGAVLTFTTE